MKRNGKTCGSRIRARFSAVGLLITLTLGTAHATGIPDLWNVRELLRAPAVVWGTGTGLTQEVFYKGEPFDGRPTRVFAHYGRPARGNGPFPAMLLVHGGGGRAFREWAEYWAQRGYVALAMDLSGNGPNGRLADGGPDQGDDTKFRPFSASEVREMWTYHAVAAVLRGHGLLRAQPEVDPERIGVTGISWGGYLTCIVAGVDPWLKVAVPVYGCGFLHENSVWREPRFQQMPADLRARWVYWFDPSQYLSGVRCPILFLNGSNDFAYPLDSYRRSFEMVLGEKTLSVVIGLPHGHIWNFPEVDAFVDRAMGVGGPFPRLEAKAGRRGRMEARLRDAAGPVKARLHYTTDQGAWQQRRWQSVEAVVRGRTVESDVPPERPLTAFLAIEDARGLRVSAAHGEFSGTRNTPPKR